MEDMVEKLFADYQERLGKKKMKKEKAGDNALLNHGKEGDPHDPPYPSSRSSSSSSSSSHHSSFHHKYFFKKQLLKLYVKFYFPIYNGELDANIMDWHKLIQNKRHGVQYYTCEFRKKELMLGIPLYTQ